LAEKGGGADMNRQSISITVPLSNINEMYKRTFVDETEPIYNTELQGKAMIAGKNINLLRFRPKLKLKIIEIKQGPNGGRPIISGIAWFHFSPTDDENISPTDGKNNQSDKGRDITRAITKPIEADLDISIDQNKGKIVIKPKYAVLEAKVRIGGGAEQEPFCQLTIPLKLESLKMELPLGVSKFNVPFGPPIKKTFVNSGSEFIQGKIVNQDNQDKNIVFTYLIDIEEQKK